MLAKDSAAKPTANSDGRFNTEDTLTKGREERKRKFDENSSKFGLATLALDYLRLEEALGRPPTLKEIRTSKFDYQAEEAGLGSEMEEAWVRYEEVVREALAGKVPKR